jgi:hypothetical protein
MASYSAILIGTDYIGGAENVTVTESNGSGSLNQLLATVGNEKFIIDSFEIWSDDADQLMQPIGLIQLQPDGNAKTKYVVPQKSRYQIQNVLKNVSTSNFPLDENTRISYNILPSANVKLTLNINKNIRKDNSLTKVLQQMGAKSLAPEIMQDLGFREPDELDEKKLNSLKKNGFSEPEEINNVEGEETANKTGTIVTSQKDVTTKILQPISARSLIIAGLVIIAGISITAMIGGAAPSFLIKNK